MLLLFIYLFLFGGGSALLGMNGKEADRTLPVEVRRWKVDKRVAEQARNSLVASVASQDEKSPDYRMQDVDFPRADYPILPVRMLLLLPALELPREWAR